MNWPCFHKWGKWSDPVNGIAATSDSSVGYFKVIQMRICSKCGIAEIRSLPQMRSIESLKNEGEKMNYRARLDAESAAVEAAALARINELEAEVVTLRKTLLRYVNEVPLGHQPHMLADVARSQAMKQAVSAPLRNEGEK